MMPLKHQGVALTKYVQVCGQYAGILVEVAFHHAIISHVVTGIAPNGVNNEH